MSDVKLFPKRRAADRNMDDNTLGRLVTMTDLMALLLCFFVMLYATHDPADAKLIRLDTGIAPVVVPRQSESGESQADAKLVRQKAGLDLNYIAALFRQAQTRDGQLAPAKLEGHDYALSVTVPASNVPSAKAAIARLVSYRRVVQVFAPENALAALMAKAPENVRYFPQNRADIVILVH